MTKETRHFQKLNSKLPITMIHLLHLDPLFFITNVYTIQSIFSPFGSTLLVKKEKKVTIIFHKKRFEIIFLVVPKIEFQTSVIIHRPPFDLQFVNLQGSTCCGGEATRIFSCHESRDKLFPQQYFHGVVTLSGRTFALTWQSRRKWPGERRKWRGVGRRLRVNVTASSPQKDLVHVVPSKKKHRMLIYIYMYVNTLQSRTGAETRVKCGVSRPDNDTRSLGPWARTFTPKDMPLRVVHALCTKRFLLLIVLV